MDIDYDNFNYNSEDEQDMEQDMESDLDFVQIEDSQTTELTIEQDIFESEYLKSLENKLQQGKLDDYSYMLETLIINYNQALTHRRFNIDNEEDNNKILRIHELKSELQKEFINKEIDELNYTRKYYNLLNLEYNLLLKYEDYTLKSKKIKVDTSSKKDINELIKEEQKYFKKIAKERFL